MPYLQAVIQEGLRCHPAVGMSLPRVTPVGGIEICGHFIREGVSFILCPMDFLYVNSYAAEFRPLSERIPGLYITIPRSLGHTLPFYGLTDGSRKTLTI
jgi:hypothetical protein